MIFNIWNRISDYQRYNDKDYMLLIDFANSAEIHNNHSLLSLLSAIELMKAHGLITTGYVGRDEDENVITEVYSDPRELDVSEDVVDIYCVISANNVGLSEVQAVEELYKKERE